MKSHLFPLSRAVSLTVLLSTVSLAAITSAASPTHLTAETLVTEALERNPEIRFYQAEIEAARGGRVTAGQYANPELNMEAGAMRVNDVDGSRLGDGLVWRASITQVFDFPGRMALRKAIAERDIALAELGLAQYKAQLANEVRARAGDVALLQRKEDAARSVRERLVALVEVLVQRDPGTVSALLERRILEATLLTSDRSLTDAVKQSREAGAELAVLCGRPPEQPMHIVNALTDFPGLPTLDKLKQQAAETNFDLQQKRLQVARQGLQVDLSKSERWGDITFGPYMAGQQPGGSQIEGGLVLSIPLPLWNKNKGKTATEAARQEQAEALLLTTLRDLERDLAVARGAYLSELEALARWRPESEKQFQEAAEEADRHYRLGAVPAATYVEMQRGYLDALDALIESRRNAWKHRMEIERLIGAPAPAADDQSASRLANEGN
jgi:cobalt-zinc-cadmium efflux system outer membrane protein